MPPFKIFDVRRVGDLHKGDQIAVDRGAYEHHMIVTEDPIDLRNVHVIQYTNDVLPGARGVILGCGKAGVPIAVVREDVEDISSDVRRRNVYRIDYRESDECFSADETVRRAKRKLGEGKYSLFTNNCEHFATWCKTGKLESSQTKSVAKTAAREGTKAAVNEAAKTAMSYGTKYVAREGAKQAAREGTKATVNEAAKTAMSYGTKYVAREGAKLAAREWAKTAAMKSTPVFSGRAKEAKKSPMERTTTQLVSGLEDPVGNYGRAMAERAVIDLAKESVMKEAAKTAMSEGAKSVTREGAKQAAGEGTKVVMKQAGKDAIKQLMNDPVLRRLAIEESIRKGASATLVSGLKNGDAISNIGIEMSLSGFVAGGAKQVATEATKAAVNEAAKTAMSDGPKYVAREGAKQAAREGTKAAVNEAAKTAMSDGTKYVAREGAKQAAREGTKAAVNEAAKTAMSDGTKYVAREGAKQAAREGTKAAVNEATKTAMSDGTKYVAREGAKQAAREGTKAAVNEAAKTAMSDGTKYVAREGAKQAAREGTKVVMNQAGQDALKQLADPVMRQLLIEESMRKSASATLVRGLKDVNPITNIRIEMALSDLVAGGGKQVARDGSKAVIKNTAKTAINEGTSRLASEGTKSLVRDGSKAAAKTGTSRVAREGAKSLVRNGGKAAAKSGGKSFGNRIMENQGAVGIGITAAVETYDFFKRANESVKKLDDGEITRSEYQKEIATHAVKGVASGTATVVGSTLGQTLIPIPVLGGMVGAMAGKGVVWLGGQVLGALTD
ncbi:Hypp8661 [Branchiostoma lanceolatum]|uniref:Hypp8661 protein n=1 Tax=Branchiostoma lanceolatum TaxID=7740 RepID=A0A8K0EI34_BRALA|nr:Hypp8661 [Branchiostoma lanceolatum]